MKNIKERIIDLENRMKQSNTCVIYVLEEEERKNDAKTIFKQIMVEKFSVLVKNTFSHIQEAQ